ncbi:MAG: Fic family protein [Lachnospiraceae bacterium]|nr:Fic family protein [Lachnospiraceae bacterium]
MRRFDYSFLETSIPANIVSLSTIIADLRAKGDFRKLLYADSYEKLRKKAIVESVKGSNAIEGIVTTDDRIRDIVNGAIPVTHEEKEISGYKEALNLIHTNYKLIDLNEDTIKILHRMLEEDVNPLEAGQYKSHDNMIIANLTDGTRHIRFKPISSKETPPAMEQMLLAFYDARQNSNISDLLLIPCFIVDFMCIHPYLDGNGRVSRLLTVLLLYMAGYDIGRYISIEGQINKYKESYYDALEQSSVGWLENKSDYTPFMVNFMQILYKCYKELDESFMEITIRKAKKSERVEAVLLNAIVPISKSDILDKLPDISVKTVELVLSNMLKKDKIVKIGSYRDARYMKKTK